MNEGTGTTYDIGEFVSFRLEDLLEGRFRIVLEGDGKYRNLIASKVGELQVSAAELEQEGLLK